MRYRWWLVPALSAALLGCTALPRNGSRVATLSQEGRGALRLDLRADRAVYAVGEPITLTLAVTNPGADPVTLTAPSSQLYDFIVLREGREIWRWSAGQMFLTVLTPLTIAPGQTRAFTETWDQRDRNGQPVTPGDYVIVGELPGGERIGLTPQEVRITIR